MYHILPAKLRVVGYQFSTCFVSDLFYMQVHIIFFIFFSAFEKLLVFLLLFLTFISLYSFAMVILTNEQLTDAQQTGLYLPHLEKDACGVGFVVSVKGVATHQVS